jgi:hypothetical protein
MAKNIIFIKSLKKRFAEACGRVSKEIIRMIPATLMFTTIVNATSVINK